MNFKVGDFVVLTRLDHDNRLCKLVYVSGESASAKPIHPFKYKKNYKSFLVNGVFIASIDGFREATAKEIKQGYRDE